MLKRGADIFEKISVGAFFIGVFQENALAVALAVLSLIACLYLTYRGKL